jgi:hypothetical protein
MRGGDEGRRTDDERLADRECERCGGTGVDAAGAVCLCVFVDRATRRGWNGFVRELCEGMDGTECGSRC